MEDGGAGVAGSWGGYLVRGPGLQSCLFKSCILEMELSGGITGRFLVYFLHFINRYFLVRDVYFKYSGSSSSLIFFLFSLSFALENGTIKCTGSNFLSKADSAAEGSLV